MTTIELLTSAWRWEPSIIGGCAALALGYLATTVSRASPKTVWFLSGVLLLFIDLVSPIDALGDVYLLSAHVVQHFLLALIIPALWVLGTPRSFAEAALRWPFLRRIERVLATPAVGWSMGVGVMLAWHIPALFNAALSSEVLHIFQHLSFLVTGAIFWWPVFGPVEERRLAPVVAIPYLFSACLACSLLGAVLTFMPPGAYPAYINPEDRLGILRLIRDGWGLDPKNDQQLGGMLMWVPGCFVYLGAILATVARWYGAPERPVPEEA